jgi:hypothetical protein
LSSGGTRIIANSPARLSAVVVQSGEDQYLSVNRSVLVREDDALYAPVREVLVSNCSKEISSNTVRDREMMFWRAVRTKWTVWAECPDEPHDCAAPHIPTQEVAFGEVPFRLAVQGVQA